MRFWRSALSASSEMNRRVACFLIQDAIARPAVLCGSGVAHFRARRLLRVFLLPHTDDEITAPAQRQTSWLRNAMEPGGKGSLQGTTMFSHSTRDLSAIRFHSLGALILAILGVRVCPIVDTRFNFCAVFNAQVSTALGATMRCTKAGPVASKVYSGGKSALRCN
jgi:hypothetical protein